MSATARIRGAGGLGRRLPRTVKTGLPLAAAAWCASQPARLYAQTSRDVDSAGAAGFETESYIIWGITFLAAVAALVQAYLFYQAMKASDEGSKKMVDIAGYVRTGANAYLRQQYKIVAVFFVVIFVLLALAAFVLKVQSEWVPFAFITGGF